MVNAEESGNTSAAAQLRRLAGDHVALARNSTVVRNSVRNATASYHAVIIVDNDFLSSEIYEWPEDHT